jgi:hypothetical protein
MYDVVAGHTRTAIALAARVGACPCKQRLEPPRAQIGLNNRDKLFKNRSKLARQGHRRRWQGQHTCSVPYLSSAGGECKWMGYSWRGADHRAGRSPVRVNSCAERRRVAIESGGSRAAIPNSQSGAFVADRPGSCGWPGERVDRAWAKHEQSECCSLGQQMAHAGDRHMLTHPDRSRGYAARRL